MDFTFFTPDVFLAFALAATFIAIAWILWPLFKGDKVTATRSSYDLRVYKDQLKEIESDLARGVLSEAEAEASRTEVSRRLLSASDKQKGENVVQDAPKMASRILAGIIVIGLAGTGYGLYENLGIRGMPDFPKSDMRPLQEIAEISAQKVRDQQEQNIDIPAEYLALIEQLKTAVSERPNDLDGHRLLADTLARTGDIIGARKAFSEVMRILGDSATAADWSAYAEIMIVATEYYVSPEAEDALVRSMRLDPKDPYARYYGGILMYQNGEYGATYELWSGLLADSGPDAPWVPVIQNQIGMVAQRAGIPHDDSSTLTAPFANTGPTDEQVNAAADMTTEERMAMIEGMVAQLADRLATEGGTAQEWTRLIVSLANLGRADEAKTVLTEALQTFADDADAVDMITNAAASAGVTAE